MILYNNHGWIIHDMKKAVFEVDYIYIICS